MLTSLSKLSSLLLLVATIMAVACLLSVGTMNAAEQEVINSAHELREAKELVDEILQLTAIHSKAELHILPKDELENRLRSVAQRIQPRPTTIITVVCGAEKRTDPRDFLSRQSQVRVTALTLREISQVLKAARLVCPLAEIAEVALVPDTAPGQTDAERWTLEFSLQEFRYSPPEKSR